MAKIVRVFQKQFGSAGPSGDFGIFGSKANPPQTFSQDPVAIQSLAAFLNGWGASIIGNYDPPLEDMNSLFLLAFRQLAYIFQEGICEWDPSTTYFVGGIAKVSGIVYNSLVDNNAGNNPTTSPTSWAVGIGGQAGGVPTGAILPWGGLSSNVPTGYILGDGSAVSRTTYSALFGVIGTSYGPGDGTTTFNLPNGKGKVLIGADGTTEFLAPGQFGGEKYHTLTVGELPQHTHNFTAAINFVNGFSGEGTSAPRDGPNTGTTDGGTGGGQPHNNLQPYQVIGGVIVKT